ncbi:RraA family protein [Rhodobacteraceae bacterium CCMM004]|nr:RraA family protein [Rhodobacteraceae bacterium CCMM004]
MIEEPPLLRIKATRPRPTQAQIDGFAGAAASMVVDARRGLGALDAQIVPLAWGMRAHGPALTADNPPADILATLAALRYARPGDVLVAATGGHRGCAAAGDRVAGMLRNADVAGFVTDGPLRDRDGILATGLPCWCAGLTPASPFTTGPGRVGHPLQIGGQTVAAGDMIVADDDGVAVVPFAEIDAVLEALAAVQEAEAALDAQIAGGLTLPDPIAAILDSDRTVTED